MTDNERGELFKKAAEARLKSYSPYSGYSVGAALLCSDGLIYTGCNIENAAYTSDRLRRAHRLFQSRVGR